MTTTDAEAKAVLIALGPTLTWEYSSASDEELALTPNGYYAVDAKGNWFSRYYWEGCSFKDAASIVTRMTRWYTHRHIAYYAGYAVAESCSPHTYKSTAAAKVACERHNATGKWEQNQ